MPLYFEWIAISTRVVPRNFTFRLYFIEMKGFFMTYNTMSKEEEYYERV